VRLSLSLDAQSTSHCIYQVRSIRSLKEWECHFSRLPRTHMTQAHAYGEAKAATGSLHAQRYLIEYNGAPVAMVQALVLRAAGIALGARINRGPLFFDETPSLALREGVMQAIRRYWRIGRHGALLIAPALDDTSENRALLHRLGYRLRKEQGWCSALVDLSPPEEEIQKRFAPVWRNRLRAAQKSGLEIRHCNDVQGLEWMLDRHEQNQRTKRFNGASRALLKALYMAKPGDFRILQAMAGSRAVGGLVLYRFGDRAEYYVGWFGDDGRKLNCGNFLYWHAICEAKRLGHRWFDVGGYYSSDKFGHFKQNLRGTEYRLAGEWLSL